MTEIQKVTMWAWQDVDGTVDYSRPPRVVRIGYWYDFAGDREYGWIVPVEVIFNTPENIEAIKKAAIALTSVRYRCGEPVNETDVRNDLLAELGLTGGGE